MQKNLGEHLNELKTCLLKMGSLVEESINLSINSLKTYDRKLAKSILSRDKAINDYEIVIDKKCQEIFALFQPVAQDLRFVIAALKINNDLERIGDMSVNIAERVLDIESINNLFDKVDIIHMTDLSKTMLNKSLNAFVNEDLGLAYEVVQMDDEVDLIYSQLIRILLTHMMENPQRISSSLDLIFIAKNLERIADLTTNISEDVIFMVEGKIIKHHNVDDAEIPSRKQQEPNA